MAGSYEIGKLVWQITGDTSGIDSALKRTDAGAKNLGSSFNNVLSKIGAAFSAYKIVDSLVGIAKNAITASAAMEQQRVAFTTMLGSAAAAQALIKDLSEFAASTPFQLNEVVDASKKLIAFGESSKTVKETLRSIGDVASGLSVPLGELVEIYGKARVQNTLYAEDLNQLAGRGVPIFEELGKVLNVDASEVKKLGSEGKVTFSALEQVFKNLTSEGGKFAGLMNTQSQTLAGKWSNFNDNLDKSLTLMGDLSNNELKELVDELNRATKSGGALDMVLQGMGYLLSDISSGLTGILRAFNDEFEKQYTIEGQIAELQGKQNQALEDAKERLRSGNELQAKGVYWSKQQYINYGLQIERLKSIQFAQTTQVDIEQQRVNQALANTEKEKKEEDKRAQASKDWINERNKLIRETADFNIKYGQTETEAIKAEFIERQNAFKKYNLNSQEQISALADYAIATNERIKIAEQKELADRLNNYNSYAQQVGGAITGLLSAFQSLYQARYQADIDALDAQLEAELEAAGVSEDTNVEQAQKEYDLAVATADALTIEEKRKALVKAQIEEKYQKKKAELEYQAALTSWQFQRAIALAQIPLAIMNAIASGAQAPWFLQPGFMIAMGTIAGITASAQFAAVEAAQPQPPKFASGGIIPGSAQGSRIIAGENNQTEVVMNPNQMANTLMSIANGGGAGGGLTLAQLPPVSESALYKLIFDASQNGDLFIAQRAVTNK